MQPGSQHLEFLEQNNPVERVEKSEAAAILRTSVADIDVSSKDRPQTITAWVSVYSPVCDLKAKAWVFTFGDHQEYMDISETDIAATTLKRGGALIADALRVELEITQELKQSGAITNHYKIKKVLDFKPAQLPE